jgi:transposase
MDKLPKIDLLTSQEKDQLIIYLFSLVEKLEKKIEELEKENKELKKHIDKNSQNSHKPPSEDKFKKVNNAKPKSNKSSGGQKGHKGNCLKESDHPDQIIKYELKTCPYCSFNLSEEVSVKTKRAQVFDIPQLKLEVKEYQVEEKYCPCCQKFCSSSLPQKVQFGVQYGENIQALIVYLHTYHLIAGERLVELIEDVFKHKLSEGSLYNVEKACYKQLEPFENKLKNELKTCLVLHADETSIRMAKRNHWLHVSSTAYSSHFSTHPKRGKEAIEAINILPYFKGTLIHDHFKSYFHYGYIHGLCNAHHIRELQYVFDCTEHPWALDMQNLLKKIKKTKDDQQLTTATCKAFDLEYNQLISSGYAQYKEDPHASCKAPKESCLLKRLKDYKFSTLLFMYQEQVPFDNNQAERDLRMMKVKMKISGCFRSITGAQVFCRIRSYISTIKKNGMAVLQSLTDVFNSYSPDFLTSIRFS